MSALKCEVLAFGLFRLGAYTFFAPNIVGMTAAPSEKTSVFAVGSDESFLVDAPLDEAIAAWTTALCCVVRR